MEIHPLGTCHVKLKSKEGTEHISWKKVTTSVHNLIVGRLWIDHTGDMTLKNWQTQSECKITFKSKSKGWFGSQDTSEGGEINGVLKDKNGLAVWEISGAWHTQISAKRIDQSHLPSFLQGDIVLWKRNTLPTMSLDQFNFTQFAMTLNEMVDAIPKSDSRLRSDQRAMESGNWDAANKNKEIIESIQRRQRTAHIESYNTSGLVSGSTSLQVAKDIGEAWWMPRWFVRIRDEDSGEFHWVSSGEYWKCRQNEWPEFVPDLFTI